jgi:histone H2B
MADVKKVAKKQPKKEAVGKGTNEAKRRSKRRTKTTVLPSIDHYLYKIVRSENPDVGISWAAMRVLSDMVTHLEDLVLAEAPRLMKTTKTLSHRDIASAIRLVCPGDVGKHAVAAGAAAEASRKSGATST